MQLTDVLSNRTSAWRNRECGNRIFILANGPSVNSENLSLLRDEIVIGMNASTMLEERFDFCAKYYVVSDRRFLNAPDKREWATTKLSPDTVRFVRADLRPCDEPKLRARTCYVSALSRDGFSHDLSIGFYFGCTTTMLAVQLSWYLGSREVYLLGCDLRYPEDSPRFYPESTPQLEDAFTSVQLMNLLHAAMEIENEGGHLVNCSPLSFLRPYLPFVPFEELF